MHGNPIHASQVIRPSVRMLLNAKPKTAATATNPAVQVACDETAFNPIESDKIAEPELNI